MYSIFVVYMYFRSSNFIFSDILLYPQTVSQSSAYFYKCIFRTPAVNSNVLQIYVRVCTAAKMGAKMGAVAHKSRLQCGVLPI